MKKNMLHPTLNRLFNAIPFRMACELHRRLQSGEYDIQTREMLRQALMIAGFQRADA
ncbi:hypothetical protein Hthe01_20510 [Hydrogenophilus thermoluteolus]|uniref:hypothetical protein n=1 Tax=Hydrogenophilus thermoluteolus TaxID=297 RepID=UPI0024A241EA|nr:hypothetical protein [Hydrogenophilus thermoluteolus]GLW61702.1 hypothetical protein Hthe01_20510 [Hydrogenophilus thermoluteolus]